jgi:hypothetical protein
MFRIPFGLILGFVTIGAPLTQATTCQSMQRGFEIKYCIDPGTPGEKSVTYYFHGAGGSELNWTDRFFYTDQIKQTWRTSGSKRPTVVSVSFDFSALRPQLGRRWLLVPQNNSSRVSGLRELFIRELMPAIERRLGFSVEHRAVFGESMGGFNAAQLGLSTTLFEKAAVICAPMAGGVTPFSGSAERDAYMRSTVAWNYYSFVPNGHDLIRSRVDGLNQLVRAFVPNATDWKDTDPIELAKSTTANTEFYVTAGAYDPYLAYEGSQRFSEILSKRGNRVEWRPQWGGHCAIDITSLAAFLAFE